MYDFTLEDEVIAYEETQKLQSALNKLQDIEQSIIKAVYFEGMSMKEAAADNEINYRKALDIRKKSFNQLKKYL